jgi:hypothetical protein
MKENSTLESKLKKYAALAGTVTAAVGSVSAQVNYTDLNPDVLVTGNLDSYLLDLNGDLTPDFSFVTLDTAFGGTNTSYFPIPVTYNVNYAGAQMNNFPGNQWAGENVITGTGTSASSSFGLANIPQGSSIGPGNSWDSSSTLVGLNINVSIPLLGYSTNIQSGPMIGTTGFIGLKFSVGGNTHYGWARVEVTPNGEILSIKDYAYDGTPNTPIVAGETGSGPVGVNDNQDFVNVQTMGKFIRIELTQNLDFAQATVTSISGQEVVSRELNSTISDINTSEIASGIYILNINSNNGSYTKKLYVK